MATGERFSDLALEIFKKRYYVKNEQGTPIETTPQQVFKRVSAALAGDNYGMRSRFLSVMTNRQFLPAGRTLANAGGPTSLIASCVVLPIEDSLCGERSIFGTLHDAIRLQQVGSGIGFDFSPLRPRGTPAARTRGVASGPCSFILVYDTAFGVVKQQGRNGANLGTLDAGHPDVLEFVSLKSREGTLRNFNLSVSVRDDFMRQAVGQASGYERDVLWAIARGAWGNGEPGLLFSDTINRFHNPLPGLGRIFATNPCGEQALHAYDACNLGSINVAAFVEPGGQSADFRLLKEVVYTAVDMLDAVIDRLRFPVLAVEQTVRGNRRIGLGVMGVAEYLFKRRLRYGTREAVDEVGKLMRWITSCAQERSGQLAALHGNFPNYSFSVYAKDGVLRRNASVTCCPPTGSTSLLYDVTGGIEPAFRLSYERDICGRLCRIKNPTVVEMLQRHEEEFSEGTVTRLLAEIEARGRVEGSGLFCPPDYLVTAEDVSPLQHVDMQAAFQRACENTVSKTVNLPQSASVQDVLDIYRYAWESGVAGITIYRNNSRKVQVLYDIQDAPGLARCPSCVL